MGVCARTHASSSASYARIACPPPWAQELEKRIGELNEPDPDDSDDASSIADHRGAAPNDVDERGHAEDMVEEDYPEFDEGGERPRVAQVDPEEDDNDVPIGLDDGFIRENDAPVRIPFDAKESWMDVLPMTHSNLHHAQPGRGGPALDVDDGIAENLAQLTQYTPGINDESTPAIAAHAQASVRTDEADRVAMCSTAPTPARPNISLQVSITKLLGMLPPPPLTSPHDPNGLAQRTQTKAAAAEAPDDDTRGEDAHARTGHPDDVRKNPSVKDVSRITARKQKSTAFRVPSLGGIRLWSVSRPRQLITVGEGSTELCLSCGRDSTADARRRREKRYDTP